jgi:flagellin-specific chaperone FliS
MEEGARSPGTSGGSNDFVLDRLLKANLKNDQVALNEAERVLETLRSGWKEMERGHARPTWPP